MSPTAARFARTWPRARSLVRLVALLPLFATGSIAQSEPMEEDVTTDAKVVTCQDRPMFSVRANVVFQPGDPNRANYLLARQVEGELDTLVSEVCDAKGELGQNASHFRDAEWAIFENRLDVLNRCNDLAGADFYIYDYVAIRRIKSYELVAARDMKRLLSYAGDREVPAEKAKELSTKTAGLVMAAAASRGKIGAISDALIVGGVSVRAFYLEMAKDIAKEKGKEIILESANPFEAVAQNIRDKFDALHAADLPPATMVACDNMIH